MCILKQAGSLKAYQLIQVNVCIKFYRSEVGASVLPLGKCRPIYVVFQCIELKLQLDIFERADCEIAVQLVFLTD